MLKLTAICIAMFALAACTPTPPAVPDLSGDLAACRAELMAKDRQASDATAAAKKAEAERDKARSEAAAAAAERDKLRAELDARNKARSKYSCTLKKGK